MTETTITFAGLGLREEIVEALTGLGYEAPTPIQANTIPKLLAGRDIIGQAQTGTGKTAAFALPILQAVDPKKRETQALVLTPTRELAMQVAEAIHSYATKLGAISVLPVYGGAPIVPQLKRLERGAHVVVGTPGRLIDHLDRGSLDLSKVKMLVLDEADEMLKMGFVEEVEKLLAAAPPERQVALFSATMPDEVMRIAKRHLHDPERVEIEQPTMTAPAIEQRFLNVSESQKLEVLTQILELDQAEATLIFRRTKNGSAELAEKLEARGFSAVAMHGDMSQPLREAVIRRLRAGQVEIVVATDVAARGLDVEQIEHVINYDVPYDVEAYVHRIGRTGRAGRSGVATLFITPRERGMMRQIERYTGRQIKPMKMPSRADIAAKRVAVFKETIRKTIQEGDLEMYLGLVEQLVEEGPFDISEVAAAAARIANGSRALVRPREEEMEEKPAASYAAAESGAAPRREYAPRAPRAEGDDVEGGKTVRLAMSVGREDGIRPADVVGSIANEADIPGREIGPIDIQDDVTFVGVPERYVEVVLAKVGRKKFRGRPLNMRVASANEGAERKPRAPRAADRGESRPPRQYDRPQARSSRPYDRTESRPPRQYDRAEARSPRQYDRPTVRRDEAPRSASRYASPRPARAGAGAPRTSRGPSATSRPRYDDTRPPRRGAASPRAGAGPKRRDDDTRRSPAPFYGDFKPKKKR